MNKGCDAEGFNEICSKYIKVANCIDLTGLDSGHKRPYYLLTYMVFDGDFPNWKLRPISQRVTLYTS